MRLVHVAIALSLLAVAVPVASATHTYWGCMNVWYPAPPPGWGNVCSTLDWWAHNPFTPLVNCLTDPLEISIIGVEYDPFAALACV